MLLLSCGLRSVRSMTLDRRWVAPGLQVSGLVSLVVGAGLWSLALAFVVAGVGLVCYGVAVERGGG
jgi:hypothetical protein